MAGVVRRYLSAVSLAALAVMAGVGGAVSVQLLTASTVWARQGGDCNGQRCFGGCVGSICASECGGDSGQAQHCEADETNPRECAIAACGF